jgi:hypothetical protein
LVLAPNFRISDLLATLIVRCDRGLNALAARIRSTLRKLGVELSRLLLALGCLLRAQLRQDDDAMGLLPRRRAGYRDCQGHRCNEANTQTGNSIEHVIYLISFVADVTAIEDFRPIDCTLQEFSATSHDSLDD